MPWPWNIKHNSSMKRSLYSIVRRSDSWHHHHHHQHFVIIFSIEHSNKKGLFKSKIWYARRNVIAKEAGQDATTRAELPRRTVIPKIIITEPTVPPKTCNPTSSTSQVYITYMEPVSQSMPPILRVPQEWPQQQIQVKSFSKRLDRLFALFLFISHSYRIHIAEEIPIRFSANTWKPTYLQYPGVEQNDGGTRQNNIQPNWPPSNK